jgi:RNA-directed DNA polymerase
VQKVLVLLKSGHTEVVDADLSGYFDSIPHAELMKSVARRVSDGRLLGLIKSWLEAPVEESDERGRKQRTTRNKDEGRGTPQGAPLSPLLANLYMRRFVLGWKVQGNQRRLDAHIVNYADDFVICCRGTADEAMTVMRAMMTKLKLTVNEAKTRLCRVPDEKFDFLGYTFGRLYSPRTGGAYVGIRPSAKKINQICAAISEQTQRRWLFLDPEEVAGRLNRMLRGWANYFRLGTVGAAYRVVDSHACFRLRQWLGRRERVQGSGRSRYSEPYLRRTFGLLKLEGRPRPPSCANA